MAQVLIQADDAIRFARRVERRVNRKLRFYGWRD